LILNPHPLKNQTPKGAPRKFVDVAKRPDLAKANQIVATPAVLRNLPAPLRKSICDFSNKEKALVSLGLFDFDNLRLD